MVYTGNNVNAQKWVVPRRTRTVWTVKSRSNFDHDGACPVLYLQLSIYEDFNCVCVCEWRKWDVRGAGLDWWRARPSYFNVLNLELCKERSRTLGMGWNLPEQVRLQADAIGEQQSKRTQSGSCSWSGRNRGAAVEADLCNRRAAAEADAIGEQQLWRRAVRRRITHVGEQGGSSWASEASSATCKF